MQIPMDVEVQCADGVVGHTVAIIVDRKLDKAAVATLPGLPKY